MTSEHFEEKVPAPPRSPATEVAAERALVQHSPSVDARYDAVIVQSYRVPAKFNLLAVVFLWILLAGFVVFPATFPALLRSPVLVTSSSGRRVQRAVQSVPLLVFAIACFVVGMVGIAWLWRKRQREYLWLVDRLFLPGCLNALAGLIAAVINVYSARDGHWSKPAVASSVLMGTCVLVFATLYATYSFVILPREVQGQTDGVAEDEQSQRTVRSPSFVPSVRAQCVRGGT